MTLAGDSAGGALALAQAQLHRDAGLPPYARVVLLSPWLDATVRAPSDPERDVVLLPERLRALGRLWAGPLDAFSPLVSPSLGDLSGLPPVHVVVGGAELLSGEARSLVERVRAAGGEATLEVADDGFHDFVAAWWTPEARRALAGVRALQR